MTNLGGIMNNNETIGEDCELIKKEAMQGKMMTNKESEKTTNFETAVTMYLKEIGQISLLSSDEERSLSVKVAEGDETAKIILTKSNLRLVVSIAKRYSWT